MKLNELRPALGSKTARKRVGRGHGSGLGKTCGAGHKGQKARTGVAIKQFEGGQNPIFRRVPKRGFNPIERKNVQVLNLARLAYFIERGVLSTDQELTPHLLVEKKIIKRSPVKILSQGEWSHSLSFKGFQGSESAIEKIKAAKGNWHS